MRKPSLGWVPVGVKSAHCSVDDGLWGEHDDGRECDDDSMSSCSAREEGQVEDTVLRWRGMCIHLLDQRRRKTT